MKRLYLTRVFTVSMKVEIPITGMSEPVIFPKQYHQFQRMQHAIERLILDLGQCRDCQFGTRHTTCELPIYAVYKADTSQTVRAELEDTFDTSPE